MASTDISQHPAAVITIQGSIPRYAPLTQRKSQPPGNLGDEDFLMLSYLLDEGHDRHASPGSMFPNAGAPLQPPQMYPASPHFSWPSGLVQSSLPAGVGMHHPIGPLHPQRAGPRPTNKVRQQAERRRERNKELAKKTRQRKKFHLEALQKQLLMLREDNNHLKALIREKLDDDVADDILKDCNVEIPEHILSDTESQATKWLFRSDSNLLKGLVLAQRSFVVTDPSLPDEPIVFASEAFFNMTGLPRDKVLGRNCRFLQGQGTDSAAVDAMRKGLEEGKDTSVVVLNYKADGTPFWNHVFLAALRDENYRIVNHVGVQYEVPEPPNAQRSSETGPDTSVGHPAEQT